MHLLRHGRGQVEHLDVVTRLRLILAPDLAQQALTMRGAVVVSVPGVPVGVVRSRRVLGGVEMVEARRYRERRMRKEDRCQCNEGGKAVAAAAKMTHKFRRIADRSSEFQTAARPRPGTRH